MVFTVGNVAGKLHTATPAHTTNTKLAEEKMADANGLK